MPLNICFRIFTNTDLSKIIAEPPITNKMAKRKRIEISDIFWIEVEQLIPRNGLSKKSCGRQAIAAREVFSRILFVLKNGCSWRTLPADKGCGATAIHNYYMSWLKDGLFDRIFENDLAELEDMKGIAWVWDSELIGGSWRPKVNTKVRK